MKTHQFDSSREAYDACQCDAEIENGDVLVIASEGVVGVAATWPFAVTKNAGDLHTLKVARAPTDKTCDRDGFAAAIREAQRLGYRIIN